MEIIKSYMPTMNEFKHLSLLPIFILLPAPLTRIFFDKRSPNQSFASEIPPQPLLIRNQTQTFKSTSLAQARSHILTC